MDRLNGSIDHDVLMDRLLIIVTLIITYVEVIPFFNPD